MSANHLINRFLFEKLSKTIKSGKSTLLLGPRQVGKSTLIRNLLSESFSFDSILLQNPELRLKYERDPSMLIKEYSITKTDEVIFIDEIQKVPQLFDSVQYLIDEHNKKFILTGSSARKLRRSQQNLLPGRLMLEHLDPLMWGELGYLKDNLVPEIAMENVGDEIEFDINQNLIYGSLPELVTINENEREKLLKSYSTIYLEEEIRAEAISRNIGVFSSFLQMIAEESGGSPNFSKLASLTGMSVITIKEYFQVLSDTLITISLPAFTDSPRRRLAKTPKYYFFDIGVRNATADLPINGNILKFQKGKLFEHFVILELFRRQNVNDNFKLSYWRTQNGLEVDLIIETNNKIIPIEIKSGENISLNQLNGLNKFMEENKIKQGYVISMDKKPYKLDNKITVLPWTHI